MKRDPVGKLFVLVLVVGFAGLAWLSRNLDSPAVARGEEWPWIGPVVRSIRTRYVSVPGSEGGRGADLSGAGSAAPPVRVEALGSVWIKAGTALRSAPDRAARVVARTDEIAPLPVVDRSADWYKIMYRGQVSWVHVPEYDDGSPPLGSDPEPPRPQPGRRADLELVGRARDLLAGGGSSRDLGPYRLVTDSRDTTLLAMLDGIAADLEAVYAQRYGVQPIDRARETVVLFDRERDYRALQNGFGRLDGIPSSGLVSRGLAAAFAGGRSVEEVAGTVIHELAHLLSRRALGPALPPWLDEGLAGDLAYSGIAADGRVEPQRLGGSFRSLGATRIWWGGRAALRELIADLETGRKVKLETLTSLDWKEFVAQDAAPSYPLSAFLVRYLLESSGPLRDGFRGFLRDVSAGGAVDPAALLGRLDVTWKDLDDGLEAWLRSEGVEEAERASSQRDGQDAAGDSGSSSRQADEPSA